MCDGELRFILPTEASGEGSLSDALIALNNAHAEELSWLDPDKLSHLVNEAFLARRAGDLDAFLLAFDQGADYNSPNFLWFRSRYQRFIYVDRIVVEPSARGRGHARRASTRIFSSTLFGWDMSGSSVKLI
jgi:predicted GNAT superfamily acetyltransferase